MTNEFTISLVEATVTAAILSRIRIIIETPKTALGIYPSCACSIISKHAAAVSPLFSLYGNQFALHLVSFFVRFHPLPQSIFLLYIKGKHRFFVVIVPWSKYAGGKAALVW